MNVLLVHNFYQQAGGEDQVFAEEGRLLEAHGHRVARFTIHNDSVASMGKLTLAKKTLWNSEIKCSIREAAKEIDAQVVHFHNTFPLISPAAYYGAKEAGAAVVQTLHNYRLLCPAATLFRDGHVCEDCVGRSIPFPAVIHKCYRQNRVASAVAATMLTVHRARGTWQHAVDAYIALTEFAKAKYIEGGLPAERIIVKPNFVDPDPGIGAGDGNFAVFVGRLTEEKGVQTMLSAWRAVYANTGVSLRIVGDGPMRETVVAAAQPQSGIEFIGRLPSSAVYDMMGAARALVFPSQWYEGQPRTIVESFAKGTPVIGSRLGSIPEMIEHGRTGLLFEAGNPDALIQQAVTLVAATTDRSPMRRAARSEYEAHFTAGRNYPMLIGCYDHAVGASAAIEQPLNRPAVRSVATKA